jgi:hypothetical protein
MRLWRDSVLRWPFGGRDRARRLWETCKQLVEELGATVVIPVAPGLVRGAQNTRRSGEGL